MNKIESLRQHILRLHPDDLTNLYLPLREGGMWSLDADLADKQLVIDWSQAAGFGIPNKRLETFGATADEHFTSVYDVPRRVEQLLTTEDRTTPSSSCPPVSAEGATRVYTARSWSEAGSAPSNQFGDGT